MNFKIQVSSFEEDLIATVARELLKGLSYLHSQRRIHRDIKGFFFLKKKSFSFSLI